MINIKPIELIDDKANVEVVDEILEYLETLTTTKGGDDNDTQELDFN